MKSKGFTLIELLAVIVVLSVVISLSVMAFSNISDKEKEKIDDEKIDIIEKSAIMYMQDNMKSFSTSECNYNLIDISNGDCAVVTVNELTNANYVNKNSIGNIPGDMRIYVYRKNNRIYSKTIR